MSTNYLGKVASMPSVDSYHAAQSLPVQASRYDPKQNRWIEGKILDNGEVVYDES